MGKRSRQKSVERYRLGIRPFDVVGFLYLFAMFGIFPWFMNNKYFNITITRYRFFMWSSILFIILVIVAFVIDYTILKHYGINEKPFDVNVFAKTKKTHYNPLFWIEAFAIANVFSFVLAENRKNASTGEQGRFLGVWFFICAMGVVLLLRIRVKETVLAVFEISALYAAIVAIYQHLEPVLKQSFLSKLPFAHYKDDMAEKYQKTFMSTFGNINVVASFLAIAVPVLLCIFVYTNKLWHKIMSGFVLFASSMTIMVANSDSAYLGIAVAVMLLFFIALRDDKLRYFFAGIVILAAGYFTMTMLNHTVLDDYDKRGGFAETLDKPKVILVMLIVAVVVFVAWLLVERLFGDKLSKINKKKICIIILCLIAVVFVVAVIIGVKMKMNLFHFNYKWGTYRGYIWTKCGEIFRDAGPLRKLFGYGQESLLSIMQGRYYDEMLMVTNKVYDNAHNELLQYLVTTGLLGMVSYIGLFISSVIYIFKRANKRVIANVCIVAMVGYFAQAIINISQPITTPFFFIFMALGLGYVSDVRNEEDVNG